MREFSKSHRRQLRIAVAQHLAVSFIHLDDAVVAHACQTDRDRSIVK